MKKKALLTIVNPLLFIAIVIQTLTIILAKFAEVNTYEVHTITGYVLFALAFVHLVLNFSWVRSTFLGKR